MATAPKNNKLPADYIVGLPSNERLEQREVCIGCWQALSAHNKQVCRRARRVGGRLCLGFCKRKWVTNWLPEHYKAVAVRVPVREELSDEVTMLEEFGFSVSWVRPFKWIGLQLLCLYTGLCLVLPPALLAAWTFDYFKTAPPFPSSVFWSRVIYVLAVWGYHSTGRTFWMWLKPEWFK